MKHSILFLTCLMCSFCVLGQNPEDPDDVKLRRGLFSNNPLQITEVDFDIQFINTELQNETAFGGGFTMGVTFNDFWMVGLNINGAGTSRIELDTDPEAITPSFNKVFWGLHNELLIFKNRIINFAIPLRVGFTHFSYKDSYVTWEGREPRILTDNTLTVEGGVKAYLNISSYVSLGGGALYRRYNERGNFTPHLDRDYLLYTVNLRFSLPAEVFEE